MSIVSLKEMLNSALADGYAVGYFEAWDSYSMEAVVEAAELERSPVIIGAGCAVVEEAWMINEGIALLGVLGHALAEAASVPVAVLLNEARSLAQSEAALDSGFNAVMLDTSGWPFDEAVEALSTLVGSAHAQGAAVEGELGKLPDALNGEVDVSHGVLTDPDDAARFVRATGIDALAVSVGNVHLLIHDTADIDLHRLEAIHHHTSVPLVVHGGTGFPPEAVAEAIIHSVAKFNVGTVLKHEFLRGIHEVLAQTGSFDDVHSVVGSHREGDFMLEGKAYVCEKIRKLMRLYGSSGRADA